MACMRTMVGAMLLVVGLSQGSLWAETPAPPAKVRIGMSQLLFRGTDPNLMLALTQPLSGLFQSQTGVQAEFGIQGDTAELARRINAGEVHFGIMHGIDYAWVQERYPDVKPLVLCQNDTIKLKAYILVRDDSDARTVTDLKGKTLAFPKRSLNHCYLCMHKAIADAGQKPDGFFAPSPLPGNLDVAMDWVFEGKTTAVVVDGLAFETYKARKPGRAKRLKVLCESCEYPTAAILYNPKVADAETIKKVQTGLTTAHERTLGRQLLTLWRLTNFVAVPDEYQLMLAGIRKSFPNPVQPAVFVVEDKGTPGKP